MHCACVAGFEPALRMALWHRTPGLTEPLLGPTTRPHRTAHRHIVIRPARPIPHQESPIGSPVGWYEASTRPIVADTGRRSRPIPLRPTLLLRLAPIGFKTVYGQSSHRIASICGRRHYTEQASTNATIGGTVAWPYSLACHRLNLHSQSIDRSVGTARAR
jgi:hypothetical protein